MPDKNTLENKIRGITLQGWLFRVFGIMYATIILYKHFGGYWTVLTVQILVFAFIKMKIHTNGLTWKEIAVFFIILPAFYLLVDYGGGVNGLLGLLIFFVGIVVYFGTAIYLDGKISEDDEARQQVEEAMDDLNNNL